MLPQLIIRACGVRHSKIAGTHAPGARYAVRVGDPSGAELSVISEGDALNLFVQRPRAESVTLVSLAPSTVLALAWSLIWRWWVLGTWCGLKLWLWNWAIDRQITAGIPVKR